MEAEAEPPPEPVLDELEFEVDPEGDAPLELLPELALLLVLPLVCVPLLDELSLVVDGAVPVLGGVGVRHGILVAGVTGAPATAGVLSEVLPDVLPEVVLAVPVPVPPPAEVGVEQLLELEVESEPSCRPAAPDEAEPALVREAPVRPAAPVAGALTGPPPSGSWSLALTVLARGASAVAASFGAVDTVASTAPAMAWIPVAGESVSSAPAARRGGLAATRE